MKYSQSGVNIYIPNGVKKKLDLAVTTVNYKTEGGFDRRLVKPADMLELLINEFSESAQTMMINMILKNTKS